MCVCVCMLECVCVCVRVCVCVCQRERRECTCTCTRGVYGPSLLSSAILSTSIPFSSLLYFTLPSSPSFSPPLSASLRPPIIHIHMHSLLYLFHMRGRLLCHHNNRTGLNLVLFVKFKRKNNKRRFCIIYYEVEKIYVRLLFHNY